MGHTDRYHFFFGLFLTGKRFSFSIFGVSRVTEKWFSSGFSNVPIPKDRAVYFEIDVDNKNKKGCIFFGITWA